MSHATLPSLKYVLYDIVDDSADSTKTKQYSDYYMRLHGVLLSNVVEGLTGLRRYITFLTNQRGASSIFTILITFFVYTIFVTNFSSFQLFRHFYI